MLVLHNEEMQHYFWGQYGDLKVYNRTSRKLVIALSIGILRSSVMIKIRQKTNFT